MPWQLNFCRAWRKMSASARGVLMNKLADLIENCIQHKPQDRPERMSEVQGELDRLVDSLVKSEAQKLEHWEGIE